MHISNNNKLIISTINFAAWLWDSGELVRGEGRPPECEGQHQGDGGGAGVWQCPLQTGLPQLPAGGDRREGKLPRSPLWHMRQETEVRPDHMVPRGRK